MATPPDVQVHGKIAAIAGFGSQPTTSVPEEGAVEIALCGYGPMTPRVGGEALFGRVTASDAEVNPDGTWTAFLYSNPLIEPAGTYYTVTTKDSNGDIVQVEAYNFQPGNWDLSNMQPYDPGQAPPPLPPLIIPQLLIVPFDDHANFDGENFTAFQMTLTGDSDASYVTNIVAGNLYTFIIRQDAIGGHRFGWPGGLPPSGIVNGAPINPDPNAITIQTFVADDSTMLYPIGPASYYVL